MEKLSREIKNTVKNFIKSYESIKKSVATYERWEQMRGNIDVNKRKEYLVRCSHLSIIETSFEHAVPPEHRQMVWDYFFYKRKLSMQDKEIAEKEIELWMYYLAKEIGLTVNF